MTCTAPPACFSISRGTAHPLRAKRRAAPDVVDLTERLADGCINAGRFAGAAGGPTGGERAGGVARLLRVATSTHGVSAMTFSAGCFMPATFFVARNLRIMLWMCVVEDRVRNTANRASRPRATRWMVMAPLSHALSKCLLRRRRWPRLNLAHSFPRSFTSDHFGEQCSLLLLSSAGRPP